MTYEEFLIATGHKATMSNPASIGGEMVPSFLVVQWHIGGTEGGNHYGNKAVPCHQPIEKEPELWELDKILEKVFPEITVLQYRKLCANVVHYDYNVHEDCDYYGNGRDYANKKVYLRELYDALVFVGVLEAT